MPSVVQRTDGINNLPSNPGLPLPPISFAGHPIDQLQAVCCSCMPKSVCIGITDEYLNNSHTIASMRCNINTYEPREPHALMYSATIPFMGYDVDLEFWLKVIDGECQFFLESELLDVNESQLINASKRQSRESPYDGFCYELNSDDTNIPRLYYGTQWVVDSQFGPLTITITAQDTAPVTGARPCLDDEGNLIPNPSALNGFCSGCGCLCTKACVNVRVTYENEIISRELVLSEHLGYPAYIEEYDTENGIIIHVVTHEYDGDDRACGLKVHQIGYGYSFVGESEVVTIQAGETGCPNPAANWDLSNSDGLSILVDFSCSVCSEGCQTVAAPCCPGYPIPKILHCTIRKGPGGPSAYCECLPVTIPIVSTGGGPFWHGVFKSSVLPGSWCIGDGQDFGIALGCGSEWTLQFGTSLYQPSPCAGLIFGDDGYEMSCYPINLQFTYESRCCGYVATPPTPPDPYSGPSSVIFEITE